jgi:hypothetical protein
MHSRWRLHGDNAPTHVGRGVTSWHTSRSRLLGRRLQFCLLPSAGGFLKKHLQTDGSATRVGGALRLMSLIQASFSKASLTVRDFLLESLKTCGGTSFGACPCSHAEVQNFALLPSPKVILVADSKSSRSLRMHGSSMPTHGLSSLGVPCARLGARNLFTCFRLTV